MDFAKQWFKRFKETNVLQISIFNKLARNSVLKQNFKGEISILLIYLSYASEILRMHQRCFQNPAKHLWRILRK